MALSDGQRVTLLKIDDALAMTHRYELEVRELVPPQRVGYQGSKTRIAVVRARGKRKAFYLDVDADDILLHGWDLPFKADTEGGEVFSGNACFNLIGDPAAIRELVETLAVFPVADEAKAKILVSWTERRTCGDEGLELLYPDITTAHAVVNRIKAAQDGDAPTQTKGPNAAA